MVLIVIMKTFYSQNYPNDFSDPKKSLVFKYFGTNGTYANGHCVEDGMFEGLGLKECVRRHWRNNNQLMTPFESPEMFTNWLQHSEQPTLMAALFGSFHFVHHLSIGGYEGDFSVPSAPYE